MFFASSIRNKLLFAFLVLSIPALITLGFISYNVASNALSEQATDALRSVEASRAITLNKLLVRLRRDAQNLGDTARATRNEIYNKNQAVTELKQRALLDTMRTWQADVVDVASDPDVVGGMSIFATAFRNQGATRIRGLYLGKAALEDAADGGEYSKIHNSCTGQPLIEHQPRRVPHAQTRPA